MLLLLFFFLVHCLLLDPNSHAMFYQHQLLSWLQPLVPLHLGLWVPPSWDSPQASAGSRSKWGHSLSFSGGWGGGWAVTSDLPMPPSSLTVSCVPCTTEWLLWTSFSLLGWYVDDENNEPLYFSDDL